MARILDDGTVIPSFFGTAQRSSWQNPGTLDNLGLRLGEVREIIYPSDPRSVTARFIEYNVEVHHRDSSGPETSTMYQNCVIMNLFGGAADSFRYTLRPDDQNQAPTDGVGVGAKVVLLCINGTTTKAVIMGGVRDTGTDDDGTGYKGKDNQADGHNLFFEFNGGQVTINDDGEVKVMFRGKTQGDGTLDPNAVAAAEGTSIFFDKNGGVKISTPNDVQHIFVDHQNKVIDMFADTQWHVKVNGKLAFETGDQISITGNAGMDVSTQSQITMKSAGVLVGAATDSWLLATTYRIAQQTQHTTQVTLLGTLAGLITAAGAALTTAAALLPIPIAGAIAAAAPVAIAAASLTAAGPVFAALASAVSAFEAGSAGYLSLKNMND